MNVARLVFVKGVVCHSALGSKIIFLLWCAILYFTELWFISCNPWNYDSLSIIVTLSDMYLHQKKKWWCEYSWQGRLSNTAAFFFLNSNALFKRKKKHIIDFYSLQFIPISSMTHLSQIMQMTSTTKSESLDMSSIIFYNIQ